MNIDEPELLLDGGIVLYSGSIVCDENSVVEIKPIIEYTCFVNLRPIPREVNSHKKLNISIGFANEQNVSQDGNNYAVTLKKCTAFSPDQIVCFLKSIPLGSFALAKVISPKCETLDSVDHEYQLHLNAARQHPGILSLTLIATSTNNELN